MKRYLYFIPFIVSLLLFDIVIRFYTNNLDFHIYNYLFNISWIMLFIGIILFMNRKIKKIFLIIIILFYSLLFITYILYFKFFSVIFSFGVLGLAKEGGEFIFQVLDSIELFIPILIIIEIILIFITIKLIPKDSVKLDKKLALFLIIISILFRFTIVSSLGNAINDTNYKSLNNKRNIYNRYIDTNKSYSISGILEYSIKDMYRSFINKDRHDKAFTDKYISNYLISKEHNNNEYTNIFKDKNLILVMMESIDSFLINENDMPTLYNLVNSGINFSQHYSPRFGGGDTFNTEFGINTGLLPPISGGHIAVTYSDNTYPYALPYLFKNNGYKVESYHYNDSAFYGRGNIHKSFGYEKYNSLIEDNIDESLSVKDSTLISNDDIYNSITGSDKFMSFIITYSAHMPYYLNNGLCSIFTDKTSKNEELDCLKAQSKETDNMFKLLIEKLNNDSKLDNTVIIGVTDHYAYGIYDTDILYDLKGTNDDTMLSNTPFFIWSKDIKNNNITKVNATVDILPTIANMFGLTTDYTKYLGNDIFDDSYNGLVYFKDYSWYDGVNYYKDNKLLKGNISNTKIKKNNKHVYDVLNVGDNIINTNYFKNE